MLVDAIAHTAAAETGPDAGRHPRVERVVADIEFARFTPADTE
jgi:hypothetical protein